MSPDGNRVGVRLEGGPLARRVTDELPSEALVRGAVQVPASGEPLIFLADHPVTGGYPVIAVLTDRAADHAAQLRPGDRVRFSSDDRLGRGHKDDQHVTPSGVQGGRPPCGDYSERRADRKGAGRQPG